jgi:hypothetical protein
MTTFSIETKLLTLSRIAKKTIWWRRFFESIQYDSMKNCIYAATIVRFFVYWKKKC